jgi:DNA polymerase-3 subunit epsilon
MRITIFDFETSGLEKKKLINLKTYKSCERAVQLCVLSYDTVEEKELERLNYIFKIDGKVLSEENIAIHGITNEQMNEEGVSFASAFENIMPLFEEADLVVAHNVEFDKKFLKIELFHLFADGDRDILRSWIEKVDNFNYYCTMTNSTDLCKLSFEIAMPWHKEGQYKYPQLKELHSFLFEDEDINSAMRFHDAESDVLVCLKCFLKLKSLSDR